MKTKVKEHEIKRFVEYLRAEATRIGADPGNRMKVKELQDFLLTEAASRDEPINGEWKMDPSQVFKPIGGIDKWNE